MKWQKAQIYNIREREKKLFSSWLSSHNQKCSSSIRYIDLIWRLNQNEVRGAKQCVLTCKKPANCTGFDASVNTQTLWKLCLLKRQSMSELRIFACSHLACKVFTRRYASFCPTNLILIQSWVQQEFKVYHEHEILHYQVNSLNNIIITSYLTG